MRTGSRKESPWYRVLTYGLEYLGRFYSSYPAYVLSVADPENRNRIQAGVPAVNGESVSPVWCEALGSWGGQNYGVNMQPIQGDLVWVSYQFGDPKHPMWSYGSYSYKDKKTSKPEEFSSNRVYGLKTPKGHVVLINDDEDIIKIIHAENGLIEIESGKMNFETDEFKTAVTDALIEASGSIKLGTGGFQPAVKGDQAATHIDNILTQLSVSGVFLGMTFLPLANAAAFSALQSQTPLIKSNKVELE